MLLHEFHRMLRTKKQKKNAMHRIPMFCFCIQIIPKILHVQLILNHFFLQAQDEVHQDNDPQMYLAVDNMIS